MPGDLGLNARERQKFSLSRAILAMADSHVSKRPVASFERDLSDEIAKRCGRDSRGLFIPYDAMMARSIDSADYPPSLLTRTLTASGGVSSGGAVVQSTVLASQYIPPNYNIPVVVEAGARVLSGLQGNVLIPKITTGKSVTWVSPENSSVSSADPTFAQVSLSPKDCGTVCDISRRLLLQANPAVDGLVRDDIAMAIQLGVDAAALVGTGASGQPTGVTGQSGVQTQAGGTNGAALTWSNLAYLAQLVGAANRLVSGPSVGFITNSQAYYHAARTPKIAGSTFPSFLVDAIGDGSNIGARAGSILGRPVHISQQVPSNLVKGTSGSICSAMYFGNWADLLIGEWGVIDMLVDPYTFSNTGAIRVRAFMTIDIAVRYGTSFSQLVDIITT
jgi:HK97 family phage major capsid protein